MKAPDVDPSDGAESSVSTSLLGRLQAQEGPAWERLVGLYGPTVRGWCRHLGLAPEDAADVGQEVFHAVAGAIGDFRRDRPGDSFRGWLWTITRHKALDHRRREAGRAKAVGGTTAQEHLAQVPNADGPADSDAAPVSAGTDAVYRRALELIRSEFAERTWKAFWGVAVDGRPVADVAAEQGMTAGAVYIAKTRVLRRLREEFADLL
jgi:RNA polymerase sigma-70 factor (ECF subfamily)